MHLGGCADPGIYAGDGVPCPEPSGLKAAGLSLWQVLNPRFAACPIARGKGRQKPLGQRAILRMRIKTTEKREEFPRPPKAPTVIVESILRDVIAGKDYIVDIEMPVDIYNRLVK